VLSAAGWRVTTATAGLPLSAAWEMLNQPTGQRPVGLATPAGGG